MVLVIGNVLNSISFRARCYDTRHRFSSYYRYRSFIVITPEVDRQRNGNRIRLNNVYTCIVVQEVSVLHLVAEIEFRSQNCSTVRSARR